MENVTMFFFSLSFVLVAYITPAGCQARNTLLHPPKHIKYCIISSPKTPHDHSSHSLYHAFLPAWLSLSLYYCILLPPHIFTITLVSHILYYTTYAFLPLIAFVPPSLSHPSPVPPCLALHCFSRHLRVDREGQCVVQ